MGGDHIDPWATPVVAVESSDGTGKGTAKGTAKLSKLSTKGATKGARDVVLPRTISRPWLKLDGSQNRSLLKRFDHGAVWVVVTLPYTVGGGRVGGKGARGRGVRMGGPYVRYVRYVSRYFPHH